jgi:hypothetical protein
MIYRSQYSIPSQSENDFDVQNSIGTKELRYEHAVRTFSPCVRMYFSPEICKSGGPVIKSSNSPIRYRYIGTKVRK